MPKEKMMALFKELAVHMNKAKELVNEINKDEVTVLSIRVEKDNGECQAEVHCLNSGADFNKVLRRPSFQYPYERYLLIDDVKFYELSLSLGGNNQ